MGSAIAACPNGCSGNGICGANDKCSCYQNWQGPDCSLRTCTYSLAWADTADGTNQAHYYAECSNKGVCDRKTGECKCFDGYEGKGCRRSTCPEGCSGHGTCEYIDELAVDFYNRRGGPVNAATAATSAALSNYVTDSDSSRSFTGFLYQLWDAQKIQGCKCDLGYSGPDCAGRTAPKGDDPLTTVKSTMMVQSVQLGGSTALNGAAALTDSEFYIVYHDPYGGVWRTDGITGTLDDAVAATRVQSALRAQRRSEHVHPREGWPPAHPVRRRSRHHERLRHHLQRGYQQGGRQCHRHGLRHHVRGQAGPDRHAVPLRNRHRGLGRRCLPQVEGFQHRRRFRHLDAGCDSCGHRPGDHRWHRHHPQHRHNL